MEKIQFYHIMSNGEMFYFDYINAWADIDSVAKSNKVPYIDGIAWIHDNKQYSVDIKREEGVYIVYIAKNKIFIQYTGASKYPPPDNVVICMPTGEVERVLTTPILPTGEKGAGFYQIGGVPNCNNVHSKEYVETYMEVSIWEREHSPWIYVYLFNVETYEFTFKYKCYK
jgi:hypothetical protein